MGPGQERTGYEFLVYSVRQWRTEMRAHVAEGKLCSRRGKEDSGHGAHHGHNNLARLGNHRDHGFHEGSGLLLS